jgi:hypothetical protein
MRRRIDAAGEAGDDDDPRIAEPGGKLAGEPAAVGRSIARADHRDHRREDHLRAAEQGQHRRRILDRGERGGIERLAPAQEAGADPFDRGEGRLGVAPAHRNRRPRQAWQRVERGGGRAKAA